MHVVTYIVKAKVKKKRIRAMAPMLSELIRRSYKQELSLSIKADDATLRIECLVSLKGPCTDTLHEADKTDVHCIVQGLNDLFGEAIEVHVNPATEEQEIGWALYTRTQHVQQGGMIQ